MKLNHLSLSVADVSVTSAFMQRYFHFTQLEAKGDKIVVMSGSDGFILVLTTARTGNVPYPADFHFGFMLGNEQEVSDVYERLIADGHTVPRPPACIRRSFAFYFHIPGGIMAEISCTL
jgi:catechol-2,3-dioxygenase